MYKNQPKRPRDIMQLAKFIGDVATGEIELPEDVAARKDKRNPHAVALGKLGASKGGKARAKKLAAEQREQIALRAARKRWGKSIQEE